MAPKRKNEGEDLSAREKKKQKISVARTIAVQSSTPASTTQNAVAGPSRAVTFDSECSLADLHHAKYSHLTKIPLGMKGLPSAIDVEKFAEVTRPCLFAVAPDAEISFCVGEGV